MKNKKLIKTKLTQLLAYLCIPSLLSSNDTAASIAGGVIIYELSDDISMDKEILRI